MAKNPTIEELEDTSKFKKVLTLPYEEVASFVVSHLTASNPSVIILWIGTILSAVLNVCLWIQVKRAPVHPSVFGGIMIGFILLPLVFTLPHEGIHFAFLKASGARDIRIGMDLRQGIIYLSAHRHVIGKRVFAVIALAPFIIISLILCVLIILSASLWLKWILSSALLVHATMCIGDVVLLGYMQEFPSHSVYTWDDVDAREAYFFVSEKEKKAV